ncbi:acyltransferase family protein [Agromyces sp. SYSU T00194]|uniref:acyltransferase family protein n=1 Tax=Agromyces chitinivorans TaxID=3158560 RepID=UPI00339329B9
MSTPHRTAPGPSRIAEIDGLRGIALTLVVVFHLFGAGRVSGGVDVFLFVSGFLLTASLARSAARGERPALAARYGRMLLRLVPAALVVLVATGAMVLVVLPQTSWIQNGTELVASALFLENWELIRSQLAYGAAGPETSPFQHFWSLSVQGQFFLVWPLVAALVLAATGRRAPARSALLVAAAALSIASLGFAAWANLQDPTRTYFDSAARFWEFGAGGLLALGFAHRPALDERWRALLGWLGLALILGSGFVIDGAAAYPSVPAVVPVGGAALVVLASGNRTRFGVDRALELRPVHFVARISYPLYLWHWPILIAYLAVRDRAAVGLAGATGVLVLAGVLAWATQRWVVEPVIARRSGLGIRRSLLAPVGAVVAVALAAGLGVAAQAAERDRAVAAAQALRAGDVACLGAAALDPELAPCENPVLEGVLVPALAGITSDDDNRAECWSTDDTPEPAICTVGSDQPTKRLLAIGDSHNNTLLGVYEEIANAYGWSIEVAGHSGCYLSTAPQFKRGALASANCEGWVDRAMQRIAEVDYDAIVVTHSRGAFLAGYEEDTPEAESVRVEGLLEAWAARGDLATPIIAIADNPLFPREIMACVEEHGLDAETECARPRTDALPASGLEAAVAAARNAHLVDLTDLMCGPEDCSPVVGHVILTRDGRHLTATFAHTLTPYLGPRLREIVER